MPRTFQALTIYILVVLLSSFLTTTVASISIEELKQVAKENIDSKPMSFSSKGPLSTEGSPGPRRKLSQKKTQISFASDPNYEMKMEVRNRIKGLKDDSLASPPVAGETDDMEKVARRNLRH